MKNKITISLVLLFLAVILLLPNFFETNKKPDDYKYVISFIKTDKSLGTTRRKNVLQYYDIEGNFLYEEVIIDSYDSKDLLLVFNLKTEKSLYSYGDRGMYKTNLDKLVTTKENDLKILSKLYENENKNIFILENSGKIAGKEGYYNTIYKNNIKLTDIEGLVIDFLVLNEYIYYQTMNPYNETINRYILNIETMDIERIDYDEKGVFLKVNNEVYILTASEFAYRVSDKRKVRQERTFSILSESYVYYNNDTNKSYYGTSEVTLENDTLVFNNKELAGSFFSKESDKYFDINYNDGVLSINGKKNKINSNNTEYRLIGIFEK